MDPKDQDMKASGESQPEQGGAANPMMMGMGMMKKMMAKMGSGGENPMAMMQKMMGQMEGKQGSSEAANPMQNMMGMCMGMQAEMLNAMHKATTMAAFATPELHALFATWMENLESEALAALTQKGEVDTAALASQLKISEASAIHLVAQLATQGKVHLRAQASAAPAN